jgi:glycosyltransferase involved in cell wall biosynthesis
VLHRPVPPRAALQAGPRAAARAARTLLAQPRRARLDGLDVRYVPFLAPDRARSYGSWGAWAAPSLAAALRRLRARFAFELVHAHYAVPAGEAVRRARLGVPLVVSEHGGDVFHTAPGSAAGARAVRAAFGAARLVLANSRGIADRCQALGARATRVVHLGADLPAAPAEPPRHPQLVTVAHLVARKRHEDVLRALWLLRDAHPDLTYAVVGDGPERPRLEALTEQLGLAARVTFHGQQPPARARELARAATAFVLPSVDEALGVAYLEAMAGGVPAVGCRGEPGPEEIAALGGGLRLVAPGDPEALAAALDWLVADRRERAEIGRRARETVAAHFTWAACGERTVAAYQEALGRPEPRTGASRERVASDPPTGAAPR